MEPMFVIASILVTTVLLKYVLKIDFKKAQELNENKELEKITDRFPENKQIAEEMLEMLDNKGVKIEEQKNTKTSLYIALTNKILIADLKNNYARIQTIAHECLHSAQDRKLLLFNFFYSNFVFAFWIVMSILTFLKIITDTSTIIYTLLLLAFIKMIIRNYLETEAITKSKYLAEKYIDKKKIVSKEEKEKLLEQYEEINKIQIPYTIVRISLTSFIEIMVYAVIAIIS